MSEDRLNKRADSREQPLARVGDTHTARVGEGASARDGDVRIELRACCVYVVEALCERHLCIVNVGTVGEQLQADAGRELRRQLLSFERAACDGLRLLTEQQRERVLRLANLTLQFRCLSLNRIHVSLSTLHACLLHAAELLLNLHDVPCLLSELRHIVYHLQLLVEHEQRVVQVGDVRDNLCLHYELIVFRSEQRHLCRTLLVEKVAEEVYAPRCGDRQRIGLRSGVAIPRSDGALR